MTTNEQLSMYFKLEYKMSYKEFKCIKLDESGLIKQNIVKKNSKIKKLIKK